MDEQLKSIKTTNRETDRRIKRTRIAYLISRYAGIKSMDRLYSRHGLNLMDMDIYTLKVRRQNTMLYFMLALEHVLRSVDV